MPKKRVLISHISTESALAQALKQRLQRDFLGLLDIFVSSDQTTIGAGAKWLEEVDKALKGADLQVVLASKESVGRPWVNFEAGAVWLRGIPVIPACHSGMQPTDLPVPLSMLQSIGYSDAAGLRKLYGAIAARLKVDTPAVDFAEVGKELAEVEAKHAATRTELAVIRDPRILVAANAQYSEPQCGFKHDVAAIDAAFPNRTTVVVNLTRKRLRELLTTQKFDILHLVLPVNADTGELIFSPSIRARTCRCRATPRRCSRRASRISSASPGRSSSCSRPVTRCCSRSRSRPSRTWQRATRTSPAKRRPSGPSASTAPRAGPLGAQGVRPHDHAGRGADLRGSTARCRVRVRGAGIRGQAWDSQGGREGNAAQPS